MPGTPGAFARSSAAQQRAREQQAVLNKLRQGQGISGARPADPIMGAIQALTGVGAGQIPTLYSARLKGQEVLLNRGGWNPVTAGSGPINVGGQTWYPAQSGQDLVYRRAPGRVGGQYGSIFSADRLTPPPAPALPGPASPAAERAYQQEASRVAQLAAQNPELQRYEAARKIAAAQGATPEQVQSAEDLGMKIWAQKYGKTLAPKVKPGQAGYDVIQGVLNAGAMGEPMDLPFAPASPLGDQTIGSIPTYAGAADLQPVGTPLPRTQFNTPDNQFKAQMFNRFMQSQPQAASTAPPINPAEATYTGATNVQPIAAGGDISLNAFSFNTPAEQRRAALFEQLLNQSLTR